MKNVQAIDGANNCTYSIFSFTEEELKVVFPEPGQDVEFIEDVIKAVGNKELGIILKPVWQRIVDKKDVRGVHGTLFFELEFKKKYHPTKRDSEMITGI